MPETPKEKADTGEKELEDAEKSSWSEDQQERGYYYDDAHGYEIYVPPDIDEESEDGAAA